MVENTFTLKQDNLDCRPRSESDDAEDLIDDLHNVVLYNLQKSPSGNVVLSPFIMMVREVKRGHTAVSIPL